LKRNIVIFGLLIVVIAGMILAGKFRPPSSADRFDQANFKGKPAPDFELETLEGQKIKLSDYKGKAVVLNFWATWCAPCKAEMPWFVDLQQRYAGQGLQIIGVAMDDASKEDIAKFAKDMGVNYPILLGQEEVAAKYGDVQFLPTTFYIDRSGNLMDRVFGFTERRHIEDSVQKALATKAASRPNGSSDAAVALAAGGKR